MSSEFAFQTSFPFSLNRLAVLLFFLALQVSASAAISPNAREANPNSHHVRRSRNPHGGQAFRQVKRSACARKADAMNGAVAGLAAAPPDVSASAAASVTGTTPVQQSGIGFKLAAEMGHWQEVTTRVWVDAAGNTALPVPPPNPVPVAGQSNDTTVIVNPAATPAPSPPAVNPVLAFATPPVSFPAAPSISMPAAPPAASVIAPSAPLAPTPGLPPPPAPGSGNSNPGDKHVFAHFMVGIVSTYKQSDWESDMRLAKSKEITGFALNIGVDPYNEEQLDLAYAAANNIPGGFDLFISFDFNWYKTSDVAGVASVFKRYANHPRQLRVEGKPFVSTFIGDGFDWAVVEREMGMEIYSMPFYQPSQGNADISSLSGLFSWAAWPGQLDNQPILANMTTQRDELYMGFTEAAKKQYMAPVSPWFYTHFGKEVSYSKNWLFYSETLWYDRWEQILKMGNRLNFLEIVTWNDYGESHYIGPFDTPHTDDGSARWAAGLDHTAHLDFAVPYIKAFKAGSSTPVIDQDMMVYWYRPHLKDVQCDGTDNCGSRPTGWEMVQDVIFVATLTRSGGSFTVTSGSNPPVSHTAGPGVQMFQVPMGVGNQVFNFEAGGRKGSDTPNITISAQCWNGIYNYNYHASKILL